MSWRRFFVAVFSDLRIWFLSFLFLGFLLFWPVLLVRDFSLWLKFLTSKILLYRIYLLFSFLSVFNLQIYLGARWHVKSCKIKAIKSGFLASFVGALLPLCPVCLPFLSALLPLSFSLFLLSYNVYLLLGATIFLVLFLFYQILSIFKCEI